MMNSGQTWPENKRARAAAAFELGCTSSFVPPSSPSAGELELGNAPASLSSPGEAEFGGGRQHLNKFGPGHRPREAVRRCLD
jgi:hypothetical protein